MVQENRILELVAIIKSAAKLSLSGFRTSSDMPAVLPLQTPTTPTANRQPKLLTTHHHCFACEQPVYHIRVDLQMPTSVLYQNPSRTTTLLDLPLSIQNGQYQHGELSVQGDIQILSAEPPEQPYPSIEPKGPKRAKLLESIPPAEQAYHDKLQALISISLQEIRSARGQRQWCLPRQSATISFQESLQEPSKPTAGKTSSEPPVILSSISNIFSSINDISDRIVSNPSRLSTKVLFDNHAVSIPPRSVFLLSDVMQSLSPYSSFSGNIFHGPFDFILMDPPWPNRSVRHSKAYHTSESEGEEPFLNVLPSVHNHLTATGIVGIWVTNKASIRRLVLTSLHQKGLQLFEEWVWVKTTTNGEPVTPLDGLWRRPYEVLLLFRRREELQCRTINASDLDISIWAAEVPVRVFVAVPDYHSRKPCVKEIIEPLLVDPVNYQAVEIFARNLTADWFSWGNQVLKYNLDCHWTKGNG